MANRFTQAMRLILGREKPSNAELGATGTVIFSGQLIDTEYLTELKGEEGLKAFDKMRNSDGAVRAGLLACKLPLLVAHWDVQPGSDSAQDVDIADVVRRNLFDSMTITWDDFLRHALLMLDYGFMVFEKVWDFKNGLYQWHKMAPRLPITIKYWHTDPEGGLESVEQWAWKDNTYEMVKIPAEKVLVFTNEREGSNFAGKSILRAAYKHWYYKNNLYAIDGMAAERHGIGLAKFTYPDAATKDQKDAIEKIGERLHAHERAYVSLPDAIKFELMGVQGQLHDIKSSIEHHDLQIVRSILLAQFINIGAKDVGSFALSSDQSGFFLMALQSVGKQICDTVNRYAIPQMVDYNWNVNGKYPKLVVSGLEHYDILSYAGAISQLVTAQALMPDEQIEAEIRRVLKLPVKQTAPVAEEEQLASERYKHTGGAHKDAKIRLQDATGPTAGKPHAWPRPLRPAEEHIAFDEIKGKLEGAEQRFIDAVAPIQAEQVRKLVDTIARYIQDKQYDRITDIDVPLRDKVADAVERLLTEMMSYGEEQVKREQASQQGIKANDIPSPDIPGKKAFIRVRALSIANIMANKMRAALAFEALNQIKESIVNKQALTEVLSGLSDIDTRKAIREGLQDAYDVGVS